MVTAFLSRLMAVLRLAAASAAVALVDGYCAEGRPAAPMYWVVVDVVAGVWDGGPPVAAGGGDRGPIGDRGWDDIVLYRKPHGGASAAGEWGAVGRRRQRQEVSPY